MLGGSGCRQAKYVEKGSYLLKKNEIFFKVKKKDEIKLSGSHPQLDGSEMSDLIRPVPNRSLKLFFYNRIDTTKHKNQIERKEEKYRRKNEKRKIRENEINNRRIQKAEEKGDSLYRHKVISEKSVKLGWREWVRTNMGQPPILLDTFRVRKSHEQLEIYLRKKGFYLGAVEDTILYKEKKKKAIVQFMVDPGKPYIIRNFFLDSASMNAAMLKSYQDLVDDNDPLIVPGNLLDEDVLDDERDRFSQYCRNETAMLGFNKNYIGFLVDTTVGDLQADVTMYVKPKIIKDPFDPEGEKLIEVEHLVYRVRDVTFYLHNPDTASFKNYERFKERCDSLGINIFDEKNRFQLLDTIRIYGKGTFIFNEEPFLNPDLLDKQNFLEIDRDHKDSMKYYKEYYVERSYRTLSNLGVFSNIAPKVEVDPEDPLGRWVVVTYDLTPLKKQSFLFEPRVSNTNGILGISGIISYTNKNLFRGAQELQLSFVGGMESQPLIVGNKDGTDGAQRVWQLNTFEWGPKIALSFPKLVPLPKKLEEGFSKRAYPRTTVDLTVNYQRRTEFKRSVFESGYSWSFQQDKVQKWRIGLVQIKYVRLNKEDFFQAKLEQLNDPFLLNSYTDHLTTIFNPVYNYSNINSNRRKNNNLHNVIASVDISGKMLTPVIYNGLSAANFTGVSTGSNGLKQLFGVPYTEFIKFDIQYVASQYINRKHKMVYRVMAGMGFASGNSPSMPYEQAFFAGGSNDIRAFQARTMAPGSYRAYADSNATLTQIGDTRFEANLEWRFEMTELLHGAVFVDAGNIWNLRKDTISPLAPSVLKPTSWREIAVGIGYGVRADFDFLIVRVDLSWALHNPHLPEGERWWLGPKTEYQNYFKDPETGELKNYESPHGLRLNFGIGYPF